MKTNQIEAFIELRDALSKISIKNGIRNFINHLVPDSSIPAKVLDNEKGVVRHFNTGLDQGHLDYEFEDSLKKTLDKASNKVKNEIDANVIGMSSTKRIEYFDSIFETLNFIENNNKKYFDLFLSLKEVKQGLFIYIEKRYNFKPLIPLSCNESNFIIKKDFKASHIVSIYNFLSDHDYIDNIKCEYKSFYSVLVDNETDCKLIFQCKNYLCFTILNNLMKMFEDLTSKRIELSNRFYTKQEKNITQNNFHKMRSDIKKVKPNDAKYKEIAKIDSFFQNEIFTS